MFARKQPGDEAGFVNRHRKGVIAGTVGAGVVAAAGTAAAAILLSTSVSGQLAFAQNNVQASYSVAAAVTGETDLDCTVVTATQNELQVDATADSTSINGQPQADDLSGSCTVEVTLTNTGQATLKVIGSNVTTPAGWHYSLVGDTDGDNNSVFAPGEVESAEYKLTVDNGATTGSLGGDFEVQATTP